MNKSDIEALWGDPEISCGYEDVFVERYLDGQSIWSLDRDSYLLGTRFLVEHVESVDRWKLLGVYLVFFLEEIDMISAGWHENVYITVSFLNYLCHADWMLDGLLDDEKLRAVFEVVGRIDSCEAIRWQFEDQLSILSGLRRKV